VFVLGRNKSGAFLLQLLRHARKSFRDQPGQAAPAVGAQFKISTATARYTGQRPMQDQSPDACFAPSLGSRQSHQQQQQQHDAQLPAALVE
jgi:hypothetical protein